MKPISPVIPGEQYPEVVYAKNQPDYQPLPALRSNRGVVLTRWKMTWWERLRNLFCGDVYLTMLTFEDPLQPVLLSIEPPDIFNL